MLSPATAQPAGKTNVLYLGNSGGKILDALELDSSSINVTSRNATSFDLSDLDEFDVLFINDFNLSSSDMVTVSTWGQQAGNGIVVVMGEELGDGNIILSSLNISSSTIFSRNDENVDALVVSKVSGENKSHPILSGGIVLNTAPGVANYSLLDNLEGDVIPFMSILLSNETFAQETNYPWLLGKKLGINSIPNVFVFSPWLQEEHALVETNEQIMVWPYFNYLVFTTVQSSVGKVMPSYASWAYSPVPHAKDQVLLGMFVLACAILSIVLFTRARKRKKVQREEFAITKLKKGEISQEEILIDSENDWERVGFHRQLSGFLKLFFLMIILLLPQLVVTILIMPRFLNPYPQAAGWYSYTLRFFEAIWLMFDIGFNYALAKYFSEHRIERPEKAYHYVQIFVWWEILSGVVQISLFAFLGSIIFPYTEFSYLSWMFIAHSLIQFPGFFLVFQYTFQGMQRSDFETISYALQAFVLRLVCQVGTVPLFRFFYASMPQFGPAFGAGIGLLIGQLLGDLVLLMITLRLYKSLNLPIAPIFAADFTVEEFRESFKFGIKMALGNVWVPAVWLLQVYLIGVYLPNSSAEQGFFEFAFTISTIPQATALLMSSMLGGLTEANKYGKKNLVNYISTQGYKWGTIWTTFLCLGLMAIGQELIVGAAGPVWERAAELLPWLLIYRVLGPISWQADWEFAAADKPLYAGIAWIVEQGIRAILLLTLIPALRLMEAAIITYIISLAIKNVLVLVLIRKKIHKWDWNLWQSFIAPILSAIICALILKAIAIFLKTGVGMVDAVLLFVITLFLFGHIHGFFIGLLGGYDDNTLGELDLATKMVTGVRGFTRLYYLMTRAGAKISPLHNRFKNDVFQLAMQEARELTAIKRRIV
ncbi:hypothetical protein GF325_05035 [Candidatus Bathyarchaeota archaeon]|nr:hypothetical protein [Candidatus Bathyarchaeota archaeon]